MIGKSILHYKIIEELGRGGMGIVYLAEDTKLNRKVAIKFLPSPIAANSSDRERFKIEAQAAAALNHSNIATIHTIEVQDDEIFIVMEYIEGKELKDLVRAQRFVPQQQAINFALQIAKGLQAAHKKGIIHRDIKSSNIMVTEEGNVKIMDFGLARIGEGMQLTRTHSTMGTVAYMSPEQTQGETADQQTDIWSFGVVMYEMLTGKLPFDGKNEPAIIYSVTNNQPDFDLIEDESLRTIVSKCLQKDKKERYESVSQLLNNLQGEKEPSSIIAPVKKKTVRKSVIHSALFRWIAAISLIFMITLYFLLFDLKDSNLPPEKIIRLTSYTGEEYYPSLSPDGKSIAFTWNGPNKDNFDIYVKLVDTGVPVRLTQSPYNDIQPAWSPDGHYIAFVREYPYDAPVQPKEIFVIPALGGRESSILKFSHGMWGSSSICWSVDGKYIFYTSWSDTDIGYTTFKVSLESKESQQVQSIPKGGERDWSPKVSPDGKYILFLRGFLRNREIYIWDIIDDVTRPVTNLGIPFDGCAWLNDSRSIIFAANLDGASALWKTDISGSKPAKLLSGININNPSVSAEGNRLAYAETIESSAIWKIDLKEPQNETLLIRSSAFQNKEPNISPDGRKILFFSNRTGEDNIWMCNSDGSNQNQITFFENAHAGTACWSPSGSKIMVNNTLGTFLLDANGGKPKLISDQAWMIQSWARDDTGLYLQKNANVFYTTIDQKREERITKESGIYPIYHDNYVYYIKSWNYHNIWRVPVHGGREEAVVRGLRGLGLKNWTVGQKGVYYLREAEGTHFLEIYDFKSMQIRKIKELPRADPSISTGIAVAPDDSYLLYTRQENKSDIILVENFSP